MALPSPLGFPLLPRHYHHPWPVFRIEARAKRPQSCTRRSLESGKINIEMIITYKPFPVALKAFWLELLDGHNHATPRPAWGKRVLVYPSFEDITEASFPKKAI
ncbi:basic helix-loop-helix (bHLH) DNA-bindingsuperfamily protein [Striga asiatica]|uniref:Basic helix-loop-helix (BHLH) DNA-bindingsuperfamily protein n=1 Tax=Striga asiatica TaxID=4170 RepID=A0A5A7Q714_STRAF|nr:basic helix-loop-helix (bHLH) DNA-bindingsuperfamily protein [Striga asiatica]